MLFLVWQYTGCVKKYAVKRGFTITNVQRAKKVVSDSPGLVDFAIGLENYVLELIRRASEFFWGLQIREELWNQSARQNVFGASWKDVWASKC